MIPIEKIFENNCKIVLNFYELKKFLNGVKLEKNVEDGVYKIYDEKNHFLGTGEVQENRLKRDVIL